MGSRSKQGSKSQKKSRADNTYLNRGMYSEILIEGFRLFKHLELKDIGQVNLFFGPNNCGKTTVLEAIFTHGCGFNFGPFQSQIVYKRQGGNQANSLDVGERFISLFHDVTSIPYRFKIDAKISGDSTHRLNAEFHPSSNLADLDPIILGQSPHAYSIKAPRKYNSSEFQSSETQNTLVTERIPHVDLGNWKLDLDGRAKAYRVQLPFSLDAVPAFKLCSMEDILDHRRPEVLIKVFSYLKRYGSLKEFTKEMNKIFCNLSISEIDAIPYPDGTQSPVYIALDNGKKIPLYTFGDGMRRWFYLLGNMVVYQNACHCIEEIDATFHPDSHKHLSSLLIQYAKKYNNQLFLTSHSIEFADAFLEALYGENGVIPSQDEDPVRVFTLKPSSQFEIIDVWLLRGREAYEKRKKYGLELR